MSISVYQVKGWVGGPENGSVPLLYVVKMSLRRWVGDSLSLKTPLWPLMAIYSRVQKRRRSENKRRAWKIWQTE